MPAPRSFYLALFCMFFASVLPAKAATVSATWNAATDVPVTASSYTATGNTVNFTLNFAPATGTNLTVVNNTGLPFISGTFDNLSQGQPVALSYGGVTYNYVAHYYGGTGNDLVLVWAANRAFAWGENFFGDIGNGTITQQNMMVPVTTTGVLAGKTIVALSRSGDHTLALCSDGAIASWGNNSYGQLGNNYNLNSYVPVLVNMASGVSALYGKTVVAVVAGYWHSMALCSDGTVAAWGYNADGELGDNTTTNRNAPVAVNTANGVSALNGKTVVKIAAAYSHSMALCSDGTLVAWGSNQYGRLGDNTTIQRNVAVAVDTAPGVSALVGKTVSNIAAGFSHSMASCTDGTLVTWGYNAYGQLGDNTTTQRNAPVAVNNTSGVSALNGRIVVGLAAGHDHSLALCSDGIVAAWGYNIYGQLGDSTTATRPVPVAVNTTPGISALSGKTVTAIATGGNGGGSSAALCADGTMATWGSNGDGDLGNNSIANSSVPVALNTSPLTAGEKLMSSSGNSTTAAFMALVAEPPPGVTTLAAAILSGSSAVVKGLVSTFNTSVNVSFDYGTSTAYGSNIIATPAMVTSNSPTAVTATLKDLLPLTTYHFRVNDGVYAGGDQTFTTPNNDASLASLTANTASLSPSFTSGTTGYAATVGLTTTSITVTPTVSDSNATVTVNGASSVSGSPSTVSLQQGTNIIYVLVTAQDGVTTQAYALAVTRPLPTTVATVYASGSDVPLTTNALIDARGSTLNFTLNYAPATGTNLTAVNNTGLSFFTGAFDNLAQGQAVALSYGGVTYRFVANYYGGTGNDLVLVWANNRAFSWGSNYSGQLGDGTGTDHPLPALVSSAGVLAGKTIVSIASGNTHALALCSDGTIASWGLNSDGQLGNNSTTNSSIPVAVNKDSEVSALYGKTVVAVAAGVSHSMALCSDGTVAAWGNNASGQLGNNSTTASKMPVAVNTVSGVSALYGKAVVGLSAGGLHTLALCSDGTVAAWGTNTYGCLGDNTSTQRNAPVAVNTVNGVSALYGKTVVDVAAGGTHSMALCSDGTLTAWGDGDYGALGDNTGTNRYVPVLVNTASGVSALYGKSVMRLTASNHFSMAQCADGTVAAWGKNDYASLGDNTLTNRYVPVLVNTASGISALYGKTVVNLSSGQGASMALCADGTLAAWGNNYYGEIGDNTKTMRSAPVLVNTSNLVVGEQFMTLSDSFNAYSWSLAVAAIPAYATVTTLAATSIDSAHAVLNGVVAAAYDSMMVSFEYGTTNAYGSTVSATPAQVSSGLPVPVSAMLTGLQPGTTYHYRVNGVNSGGTLNGNDLTFTTLNNNANLANMVPSTGALSPVFASGTFGYTTNVPYLTTSITITPTLADANAQITVNGAAVSSGSASSSISLAEGSNSISVTVTAQDGITQQTYTVNVVRATGPMLSGLGLSNGTLSPAFASTTTAYTATIPGTSSTLALTPAWDDSNATVTVNGQSISSGNASSPIAVNYGSNPAITLVITAPDGVTTRTYTVAVSRTLAVTYSSGVDVALTSNGFTATGGVVSLYLNYTPTPGTSLTVVNNTGLGFISGTFDNLSQGQAVPLTFNGITYNFVANYYGGTGNDLVLAWADTRAFGWGSNSHGQLGDTTTTQRNLPVPVFASGVLNGKVIVAMATGGSHTLALCSDGTLVAWGNNGSGQLGDGTTTQRSLPVLVNTASGVSGLFGKRVVAISAGFSHSLALCSDGTVAAWGDGSQSQLGNGSSGSVVPRQVINTSGTALFGKTVVAVAAGFAHSLALCSDGTVAAWGYNASGQLGTNNLLNRPLATAVNTTNGVSILFGKVVSAISSGGNHSMALCSDGTLAAWGYNFSGQIGDNSTTTRKAPVAVNTESGTSALAGKTVAGLAAGGANSLVLCTDGNLVAWGDNTSGTLGDNSTTNRLVPVLVNTADGVSALSGKTVTAVTAGSAHNLALTADGALTGWGWNNSGQVGDNTTGNDLVPVTVNRSLLSAAEVFAGVFSSSPASHSVALVAGPPVPKVSSLAATSIATTSVTLNGAVNASSNSSIVSFDYGATAAYDTTVAATPATVTGASSTAVNLAVTGLIPGTTYHFRVNGTNAAGTSNGVDLTFTTLSLVQSWRQTWFGTTASTGAMADAADFDNDGIPNLIEWACRLDPTTRSTTPLTTVRNEANFEVSYSRSTAAAAAGAGFTVEWSDTLAAGSWSSTGVTQTVLSDDGTTQQVQAVIPVNAATKKFIRLSVMAP